MAVSALIRSCGASNVREATHRHALGSAGGRACHARFPLGNTTGHDTAAVGGASLLNGIHGTTPHGQAARDRKFQGGWPPGKMVAAAAPSSNTR